VSVDLVTPELEKRAARQRPLRIAVLLPRSRRFGPDGATAIDLCVRDFTYFSRHRGTTTVFGEPIAQPFEGIDFRSVAREPGMSQWSYSNKLAHAALNSSADIVVVHQHMPTAVRMTKVARRTPVLLHRHNVHKRRGGLARWRDARDYGRLAATIWVSNFCRDRFVADYPAFAAHAVTVHNGLDFSAWQPANERENVVLFAGRLAAEKGCLPAALAVQDALAAHPDWRAKFLLARRQSEPGYLEAVMAALAPLGDRAEIKFDVDHALLRTEYCRAAIALVPSVFEEPFGRTAIEAFAGGSALITSMRGGLREICEGVAVEAVPESAPMASAIQRLIATPELRAQIAAQGRKRGETLFDVHSKANQLDELYEDIVNARTYGLA
jgi:glycosyltransferase involved in cell wall biosynthesis